MAETADVLPIRWTQILQAVDEESRMHVHIQTPEGVAKFWLEPIVAHADSYGLGQRTLRELAKLVEENADAFRNAWQNHLCK